MHWEQYKEGRFFIVTCPSIIKSWMEFNIRVIKKTNYVNQGENSFGYNNNVQKKDYVKR